MRKLLILLFVSQLGFAADTTLNPDNTSLTERFYKFFWGTEIASGLKDLELEPNKSEAFFKDYLQELILKIRTGAGTQAEETSSSNNSYSKIADGFDACINNSIKNHIGSGACEEIYNLRKQAAQIEQCYANIRKPEEKQAGQAKVGTASSSGLTINGVVRNQTMLEKENNMVCEISMAKSILGAAAQYAAIKYSRNTSDDVSVIKNDMENIHRQVLNKLKEAKINYIIKQNKNGQIKQKEALIDTVELADTSSAKEFLTAFNDIVTIKQYLSPVRVFKSVAKDGDAKIISSGDTDLVKNFVIGNSGAEAARNVNMHRKSLENSINEQTAKQAKLISSFGTLKENAMLNIASLIAERTPPKDSEHSMLYNLNKAINDSLKMSNTDLQEPAKLLKQIRDAINLNNKLNYMIYLAEERIQMALSVNQIGELKPLADAIDENAKKIDKLSFELDLGSEIVK